MDSKGRMPKLGVALTADAHSDESGGALLGTSTTGSVCQNLLPIKWRQNSRLGDNSGVLFFACAVLFAASEIIPPEATASALVSGNYDDQGMRELN
ncbi:MAG: hypothetical protein ACLUKN_03245 [Bacilli bacterium]